MYSYDINYTKIIVDIDNIFIHYVWLFWILFGTFS